MQERTWETPHSWRVSQACSSNCLYALATDASLVLVIQFNMGLPLGALIARADPRLFWFIVGTVFGLGSLLHGDGGVGGEGSARLAELAVIGRFIGRFKQRKMRTPE